MDERYTDIRLLKVPIEIDDKNQLDFTNATSQYNYFNSCTFIELPNSSYQRKDSTIRYPGHIDDLIGYNYCMYKNTTYSNKWYYAFITDMSYISDSMTLVSIKTDVWQTWQFDITFKNCFVEREHVNSDKYAEHTIPENLQTGEYINAYSSDFSDIGESHIVMGTTISPIDGSTRVTGGIYGGIYSGVKYYIFETITDLNNSLNIIATNGNSDSIVSLFYCPDFITGYDNATFTNGIALVPNSSGITEASGIAVPLTPNVIDGYTPKNKKCFTYPYVAYLVSNNSGGSNIYRIEDFYRDEEITTGGFSIYGACCPGASIRLIPEYYKVKDTTLNLELNNEYGLNAGKFPVASWGNDTYTNWLTQNGINIGGFKLDATQLGIAKSFIPNIGVSDKGVNASVNPVGGIFNSIQEDYKHEFNSMQAQGNTNSGDVTYSAGKLTFTGYFMTVKKEYIKIIDDFFSTFGYKVNSFKIPNIKGRTFWNYVKTIECNILGDIPQADLIEIKNIFNAGVTFWHDPSKFLDYSQNNTIVS